MLLLISGEHIDNTVNGFGSAHGMQGREDKLSRFGCSQYGLNGFKIPHFSQQNDIGSLPQCCPQSLLVSVGVMLDFPLADDAFLMGMQIFDWILNGNDMVITVAVDFINHTSQGGGFSASRRTGDQDESPLFPIKINDRRGNGEHIGIGQ